MDNTYAKIENTQKLVRIINIQQIVQIVQESDRWVVTLIVGSPFSLSSSDAEQLFKYLGPGIAKPRKPEAH